LYAVYGPRIEPPEEPMLDIRLIRRDPDGVRSALARRGDASAIDRLLALDEERRKLLAEVEELKHRRNVASEEINRLKRAGGNASEQIVAMRAVSERIRSLDEAVRELDGRLEELLLAVPNLPLPEVPNGNDDSENVVVKSVGEVAALPFPAVPHWELGERLSIIDFERGVRLAGSRFYVLKGSGARLQRALIQWFLDIKVQEQGYTEVYPPFVVREQVLWDSGQLPKFRDNLYHDAEEDYWLVPTAEVPVTSLHAGEILEPETLPLNYCAYTACFRREKMSAGRDVRGIKRGHQFDKVEMYKFVAPERSADELQRMVADAEEVCRRLQIPYQVKLQCTGDLGFCAAITYDLELWAPGVGEWLEVSSCSNVLDFQARRANIRFRRDRGSKPEFVHTLNGSGLALPRTVIAVLENYQQPDGSVVIPGVLRPYMGGIERIEAR
jgi:seryl-tRNA synthetase